MSFNIISALWCFAAAAGWAQSPATPASNKYVSIQQVWPRLQLNVLEMGDRIQKPGKERTVLVGTLVRGTQAPQPVTVTWEAPGLVRLEETAAGKARTILFDGVRAMYPTDKTADDEDLLETVLNDTAEHFFYQHIYGGGTRALAESARADDGKAQNYTGPYLDVYQVWDAVQVRGVDTQRTVKIFAFNSGTRLLDRVQYSTVVQAKPVQVLVTQEWQRVAGQAILTKVTRTEDGKPKFILNLPAGTVSAGVSDAAFAR